MEHFSLSTRHNLFYKCSLIQKSISVFRLQNTSKIFTFFESCHSTRTQIEYCTICFDLQNFIIFPCICACAWVRTHILYAVLLHEIHIFLQCSQLCLNIFGVQRPDYFFFHALKSHILFREFLYISSTGSLILTIGFSNYKRKTCKRWWQISVSTCVRLFYICTGFQQNSLACFTSAHCTNEHLENRDC